MKTKAWWVTIQFEMRAPDDYTLSILDKMLEHMVRGMAAPLEAMGMAGPTEIEVEASDSPPDEYPNE